MFYLHDKLQYYLYPGGVDMRKSFYTLSGLVCSVMKRDVRSGEAFIFVNRSCTIMKILHLEHAGLVIYHKRLENGVFSLPSFDDENTASVSIGWHDLMMMVQQVKVRRQYLKRR
jgi:transposase